MRFLVLAAEEDSFARWDAMTEAERGVHFEAMERFAEAVQARGAMVDGGALDRPGQVRTVRPGETSSRPVTDGPFAETVEQLGGFWLVELPDLAAAVEAAKLLPPSYSVEVRPIIEMSH
ncbi:YciI family protein [Nocardioides speluncae]|uniref:YciI family protein n=1 Tax=Nocardioides speluncae TaxID=2670337 RepID=UPI000D694000|nr:YciI family protein [Nocardioides speluncae]